jgi:type IV pilus biogenesis protein CpaD/CtpE
MRVRWKLATALVSAAAVAATLSGCGETMSFARLPEFVKLPEKVLSKDEQQRSINTMIEKGQTHQSEAAKDIEKGK